MTKKKRKRKKDVKQKYFSDKLAWCLNGITWKLLEDLEHLKYSFGRQKQEQTEHVLNVLLPMIMQT